MKRSIPSIPQLYRNVRRWTEIISVLSKYGLASWLSRFNIEIFSDQLKDEPGEDSGPTTTSARIRMALSDLGPTFIKFGQLLSTRADLVGPELALELEKLQSNTPADPFEDVRDTIQSEQGKTLDELFQNFEETPIASASIGQVHRATLHDGSEVVVKVRHKGIDRIVETDLDILAGLAQLANRLDDFKNYQPPSIVADMSRMMRRELDLERECRNIVQFRSMFKYDRKIAIPKPVVELCSLRMLTMEYLDCIKLRDVKRQPPNNVDLDALARDGANAYLRMIFEEGFYQADPHPGNIVLTQEGALGLLDFGMVSRISENLREDIETMLASIVSRDVPMLVTLIKRVGRCPHDLNESQFSNDVADYVGQYSTVELSHFDMSGALTDFLAIVRRYNITLPSEASVLIKVLVTLEGSGRLLNPEFSLMQVMKPFQRKMMFKRLSPARQARKMRRFYIQVEQLMEALPNRVSNILEQIQSGRFDVHLDHRRLGPSVNRLVVGLMTSAMFIGSSWMVSSDVPPVIFANVKGEGGVSLLGLTGIIVSLMMGLRLLWAIRKSGNLDQSE
jgi:ubiquinone biosynthesis protein